MQRQKRPECRAIIDRLVFGVKVDFPRLPALPGYKLVADYALNSKRVNIPSPYGRVCKRLHIENQTKVDIKYQPTGPRVYRIKVIMRAADERGVPAAEIAALWRTFRNCRLLLIEIAFDFALGSAVNRSYIQLHGKFGKSRVLQVPRQGTTLYYGDRKSSKVVRAYRKAELNCFRVELELHPRLIRKLRLQEFQALPELVSLLIPDHIRFVRFNFDKSRNLCRRHGIAPETVQEARRERSLHRRIHILRDAGIRHNLHRFLTPLKRNRILKRALRDFVYRQAELSELHAWRRAQSQMAAPVINQQSRRPVEETLHKHT